MGKMAEEEVTEADLSGRLATVLEEIRDVMEKRKQRIEELRQEITMMILRKRFPNCSIALANLRRRRLPHGLG